MILDLSPSRSLPVFVCVRVRICVYRPQSDIIFKENQKKKKQNDSKHSRFTLMKAKETKKDLQYFYKHNL